MNHSSWKCEWCDYLNTDFNSGKCEICKENSTLLSPPKQIMKLDPKPEVGTQVAAIPKEPPPMIPEYKEYNRKTPITESIPKLVLIPAAKSEDKTAVGSVPPAASPPMSMDMMKTALIVANLLKKDANAHVCFMDPGNINCIICSKPMILLFAAELKYPDWLPSVFDDKINMFNELIDEPNYYDMFAAINGCDIPGMTEHMERANNTVIENDTYDETVHPMHISIVFSTWAKARYRGPNVNSLLQACNYVWTKKRPIVIPMTVLNLSNIEEIHLLLITPPESERVRIGKVSMINARFDTNSKVVDALLESIIEDVNLESPNVWLYLTEDNWIQECRFGSAIFHRNDPPATLLYLRIAHFKIILGLTVASSLCSGLSLPSVLDMFASLSTIADARKLIETTVDRTLAHMFKEML